VNARGELVHANVRTASLCAFAMIANQIAGKAVRDALFLSQFNIEALPSMIVAAAVTSLLAVLVASQMLRIHGPQRLVPLAFGASALILLLIAILNTSQPRFAAIGLYLHIAVFGAILVSWFWSLLSERFDARTARAHVSRIAAGGTFGGLIGGLMAERIGAMFSPDAMLPILAALHVLSAVISMRIGTGAVAHVRGSSETRDEVSGFTALRESSYLRNLATLVFLSTLAATFLDFAFKAFASQAYADSSTLLRFFAGFYTITAFLAFLAQTLLVPRLLKSPQNLSRSVSTLPAVVLIGGTVALLLPTLAIVSVARSLEGLVRNSFFRSSYEVFFNPIPAAKKRAAKTIIDVGFDRLGDFTGGLLIQGTVLLVGVTIGVPCLLALAVVVAGLTLWRIRRLPRGYSQSLEGVIRAHMPPTSSDKEQAAMTQSILLADFSNLQPALSAWTMEDSQLVETSLYPDLTQSSAKPVLAGKPSGPDLLDSTANERLVHLRSRDAKVVRRALDDPEPLSADMFEEGISLLAWDPVCRAAAKALQRSAATHAPLLIDVLLDPSIEFAIRRRIPAILAVSDSPTIVDALLNTLVDKRFEVRYQAALALARIHRRLPELTIDQSVVLVVVGRETHVDQRIWNKRQLLDEATDEDAPLYRDVLDRRTHRSLQHLFHLLSLAYPIKPLRIAYDGLHTGDPVMRATALEYLESILPAAIRKSLLPLLGGIPSSGPKKPDKEILDSLLLSHESILLQLKNLKKHGK
jgi:AAA family ATP:ADP antiporter